jgi:predicted transcriptional regulator
MATTSIMKSGTVGQLMSRFVQTVRTDDDIALARQMMMWGGYRHLPVVSGDRLVGAGPGRLRARR